MVYIRYLHHTSKIKDIAEALELQDTLPDKFQMCRHKKVNEAPTTKNLLKFRMKFEPKDNNVNIYELKTVLYTKLSKKSV